MAASTVWQPAGLADGSMHWVGKDTPEAELRAAITRNGGEGGGRDRPGREFSP